MPIPSKPCFLFVIQLNRDEKIYNAPAKVTKSLWFLCVCVCVQIFCTHSCMHVYVCANTYEGQKLISIVFFNALHLVLWNRLSLWIWKPQIKHKYRTMTSSFFILCTHRPMNSNLKETCSQQWNALSFSFPCLKKKIKGTKNHKFRISSAHILLWQMIQT